MTDSLTHIKQKLNKNFKPYTDTSLSGDSFLKSYLIFILIIMVSFTGYIVLTRPGALPEMSLKNVSVFIPSAQKTKGAQRNASDGQTNTVKPPYFTFVSGDVLLTTEAKSYLAENNITIREKDEIFTGLNSFAVVFLGKNQYLRIGEATKVDFLRGPRRQRGYFEFKLKQGAAFTDFFKSKAPLGIRVHFGDYYLSSQDSTFRLKVGDYKSMGSVDRGSTTLMKNGSQEVFSVEPGEGLLFESDSMKTGSFSWVDNYPWDKRIKEVIKTGYGREATFNAATLSSRPQKKRNIAERPKRARPFKKGQNIGKKVGNFLEKVGAKAKEGLKNIPSVGKVQESAETIQNFEKLQQDRANALDNIGDE